MTTVSVIVNNFNYGRYVAQAIESALRQTHKPLDVIVVDDGSTDDSGEIIRGFGSRITAVFQPNQGQAAALNAGFAVSQGQVIIFLDADDVLLPGIAAQFAEALSGNPQAARAHCRMAVMDANGRLTGALKPAPHLRLLQGDLRQQVLTFPDDMPWLPTSGNAYAARVLREIMPIPETEFRILADFYLSHLTPLFGPVMAVEAVGAHYRVHGSNNYARDGAPLDLAQVRRTIRHWHAAHVHLVRFAGHLGLAARPTAAGEVLSVAFVANRLISLKLDPARHPLPGDRPALLARLGWRAAGRRFDVSPALRAMFRLWFMAMAIAPAGAARWLGEAFLLPERRMPLNRWLGRLHRSPSQPVAHKP